jgi:hypothetical protein
MLLKSKSILIIIIAVVVGMAAFGTGAYLMQRTKGNSFAKDGYVLMANEETTDQVQASDQIWFSEGASWASLNGSVTFTDAQGNDASVSTDSFVHYSDDSITSVATTAVMDLDEFRDNYIDYYQLTPGVRLYSDGGSYTIEDENAGNASSSFSNFMIKSSDTHYLLGSAVMALIRPDSDLSESITSGFLEISYLEDDWSIVSLCDGENTWTILSGNSYIRLDNGVLFNLATASLEYPTDEENTLSFSVSDLNINLDLNVEVSQNTVYPTYRFTVVNGQDGSDGENGADGETGQQGEEGEEGEQGEEGASAEDGTSGVSNKNGKAGEIGIGGGDGGLWDGIQIISKVPVIQITDWNISGKGLRFTVYMDEDSCDSVVPETSKIILEDLDSGSTYTWSQDRNEFNQYIDFSEDSAEGFELYYNKLEPGHSYRLSVSMEYVVNDVRNEQTLLVRNFIADDYGIVLTQTQVTEESARYNLSQTNTNVKVNDFVYVYRDGEEMPTQVDIDELEDFSIDLDSAGKNYELKFEVPILIANYDYNKEAVWEEKTLTLYDTVVTTKKKPVVGGVSLTPYNTGYLMAEIHGEYLSGSYQDVEDEDSVITQVTFELYKQKALNSDNSVVLTELVETRSASAGYICYFPVTQSGTIEVGTTYYVRAYYTYTSGTTQTTAPVLETRGNQSSSGHVAGSFAWDEAVLNNLNQTTMSFTGAQNVLNEAQEVSSAGIVFNRIIGTLAINTAGSGNYVISDAYPVELQISGELDYYNSIKYGSIDTSNILQRQTTTAQAAEEGPSAVVTLPGTVTVNLDLTGLRAGISYMLTVYGYEETSANQYSRVMLGSIAVSTAKQTVPLDITVFHSAKDTGIGCDFYLGDEDAKNYYNIYTNNYEEAYSTSTDAVYRTLAQITFGLYVQGQSAPIGTCTVKTNNISGSDADTNTLYEKYYGENAEKTLATTRQNYSATVGVGTNYEYRFVDSKGRELGTDNLSGGTYYIKVISAYDYTMTRYTYRNTNTSYSKEYEYYTYNAAQEKYVNKLELTANSSKLTTGSIKKTDNPFLTPGSAIQISGTSDYIGVEYLRNDELGAYNGDSTQSKLYCQDWDSSTIAGIKLTSNYLSDISDEERGTTRFTYYGYTKEEYDAAVEEGELIENGTTFFECSFEPYLNRYREIPEVWLLFCDETMADQLYGNPNITPPSSSDEKGYIGLYATTKSDGTKLLIYYMEPNDFYRGGEYYFAYDAELEKYVWNNGEQANKTGFQYPQDYYKVYGNGSGDTLTSSKVEVSRQTPKVYSSLEKTVSGTDTWKVYVQDPDDAIDWESMLGNENNGLHGYAAGFLDSLNPDDSARAISCTVDGVTLYVDSALEDDTPAVTNLTNKGRSDRILQKDNLQKFKDALKSTKSDQDTLEVYERGTTVTVNNLGSSNVYYMVTASYRINSRSSGTVTLLCHNYSGMQELNSDSLTLVKDESFADHDTMRFYLNNPNTADNMDDVYLSQEYLNKVGSIAAIAITAKNASNNNTPIYEYNANGTLNKNAEKTLWLSPEAPGLMDATNLTDYRYYVQFALSDFDNTVNPQYKVNDTITFSVVIYYVTGETADLYEDYYTSEYVAFKNVATGTQRNILYGKQYNNAIVYFSSYYVVSGTNLSMNTRGAGGSLYRAMGGKNLSGTLPWTQSVTVYSDTFNTDTTYKLLSNSNLNTMNSVGYTAVETMKVASFTYVAQNTSDMQTSVRARVPSLLKLSAKAGISTVNLTATVKNYTQVEYPEGESLHFYYIIEKKEDNSDVYQLYAAAVGEAYGALKDGVLNENLKLTSNSSYKIYMYYKSSKEAGDLDENLFTGISYVKGSLYTTDQSPDTVKAIAEVVRGTDQPFASVPGMPTENSYISASTKEGIRLSATGLSLNYDTGYLTKSLVASATIADDIVDDEKDSIRIFYVLQRASEDQDSETESEWTWETVVEDKNDPEQTNGARYWPVEQDAIEIQTGYNSITESSLIYPGNGKIVPGYYYRIRAKVVQSVTDASGKISYVDVTARDSAEDCSKAVLWSSWNKLSDTNMVLQTSDLVDGTSSITLNFRVKDLNYTSCDGTYKIRLEKYDTDTKTWVEVSSSNLYPEENMDKTYKFGTTYTVTFGSEDSTGKKLDPDTKYQMQIIASMDTNFDNILEEGSIATGSLGSTLATETSSSVGTLYDVSFDKEANTVTLYFTGSYQTIDVKRVVYSLDYRSGSGSSDTENDWSQPETTIEKGQGNLFSGDSGRVSITIKLPDDVSINSVGHYVLPIRFESSTTTIGSYTAQFDIQ